MILPTCTNSETKWRDNVNINTYIVWYHQLGNYGYILMKLLSPMGLNTSIHPSHKNSLLLEITVAGDVLMLNIPTLSGLVISTFYKHWNTTQFKFYLFFRFLLCCRSRHLCANKKKYFKMLERKYSFINFKSYQRNKRKYILFYQKELFFYKRRK